MTKLQFPICIGLALIALGGAAAPTRAQVAVQLCIAMDGSGSINPADFLTMKDGLAAAIRNPDVAPQDGSVEISIIQFGKGTIRYGAVVEVAATVITDSAVADAVANAISAVTQGQGSTPTHDGIDLCNATITGSTQFTTAGRQVVNVPTDGQPDDPSQAVAARDAAIAAGIDEIDAEAIGAAVDPMSNGFAFLRDQLVYPQPGYQAPPFTRGGFVISVATFTAFPAAISQKIQHVARPTRVLTATLTLTPAPSGTPTRTRTNSPRQSPTPTETVTPTPTASPTLTTAPQAGCVDYLSGDVPKLIPDLDAASSVLVASNGGVVTDVDVISLQGTHTYVSDLEFHLISPTGTDLTMVDQVCGNEDDFDLALDDAADTAIPCPPTDHLPHVPSNALSAFNGEDPAGAWTLQVVDRALGDTGELDAWGLRICVVGKPTATLTSTPAQTASPTATVAGDCCSTHSAPGCEVLPCTSCVCQLVPDCCAAGWDDLCTQVAANECAPSCGCAPTATPTPSATYSATRTPTLTFTATPTRTATPTFTASPTRTPTAVDLIADRLEVVQAIQDLSNSVRLVANKRTFVRFHVRAVSGLAQASAALTVQHGSNAATLAPLNPGGQILLRPTPDRAQLDHAFLFELPNAYRDGIVALTAEVNPAKNPPESSFTNNAVSTSVSFEPVPQLNLVVYGIGYAAGNAVYYPAALDREQMVVWMRRALPVSRIRVWLRSDFRSGGLPACEDANNFLAAKRLWDLAHSSELPANTHYYGMVADGGGFMRGCAVDIPSSIASGPTGSRGFAWDTDGSYGDWYGAHELSHTWGRHHAEFCGAAGGRPYPHPDGRISSALTGDTALYGFDIVRRAIYGPNWHDVMTYCAYQWVSDFTTHGLMDSYQSGAGAAATRRLLNSTDRLLVIGSIDPKTGETRLEPLFVLPDAGELQERVPGDYAIVLRDATAAELARYPFTPHQGEAGPTEPGPARDVDVLFINELVPFVDGTARVDIEGPGGLLYSVSAGPNPPALTIAAPNGGEVLDRPTVTVSWAANDPDGDPLVFDVQYSHDNGTTWEMVAQNVVGDGIELDANNLAAGPHARFRVWASDGIHTASDESDAPFTVPNHVPAVAITEPSTGITIALGQTLTLDADAYDIDTGTMADERVEWRSDIDGLLGNGTSLSLSTLSAGTHTITVRADDGAGGVATKTVQVTVVSDLSQLPSAPDALVAAPSLISFDPAAGATRATLSLDNRNVSNPLGWEAAASEPWVQLATTSGETPAQVTVLFTDTGLQPGTYAATITVTGHSLAGEIQTIPVELRIAEPSASCIGDCNTDSSVTIDELINGVNIALGTAPLDGCPAFDGDRDLEVTVDELIQGVNNALLGCSLTP